FMKFELKEFFKEYFYQAGYPLKRYSRNLFWNNMTLDRTKVRDLSDHFALNAENQIFAQRSPEPLFTQSPHWIFKIFAWVAEKDYYLSYPLIRSIEDHLDKTGPIFFGEETRAEVQACFKRVI
ncbi:MAG: hypothetical protein GWM98_06115, partial [Nitrospinaceae bacterium]|nr:hypothetical protein [Nitrospinaceae bacterium]NIR54138.1 hypothetical protein [Nitrospinaceae bacterium]NIS84552.1 hypothetical protein [Nitrospinaceae bacterium]NIT81344.1 hypothetical protein [Nitrospinaceae bacterium]NIU43631.1 hypothetical protein [Nitrospinaceae bacterium]